MESGFEAVYTKVSPGLKPNSFRKCLDLSVHVIAGRDTTTRAGVFAESISLDTKHPTSLF